MKSAPRIALSALRCKLGDICYSRDAGQLMRDVRGWFDRANSATWPLHTTESLILGKTDERAPILKPADFQPARRETCRLVPRLKPVNGTKPTPPPLPENDASHAVIGAPAAPDADTYLGVLAPHIDFRVSPASYTHAFAPWLKMPEADVVVILGVGHRMNPHSPVEWSVDSRNYVLPMGRMRCERNLVERLNMAVGGGLLDDPQAHEGEHSIEFPLVLVQALSHLRGKRGPTWFAPILCGGLAEHVLMDKPVTPESELSRLAGTLRCWTDEQRAFGRRVHFVISIDGCHIGPRFGHDFVVDEHLLEVTEAWEEELWRQVEAGDVDAFLEFLRRDGNARHFDGVGALALMMKTFGERLKLSRSYYEQWYEEDDRSAVSFTSGWLELH